MNMNGLSTSGYLNSAADGYQKKTDSRKNDTVKTEKGNGLGHSELKEVGGRTIGEPKLSEKALKYYERLKRKFSNMDFILVAPDKVQEAENNKGLYTSSKELIVLIDSDKIEKMAEDPEYRKKYEGILSGATAQIEQMKNSLGANADRVSSFGMTFDDEGNASFFAVVDKSLALQRERIAAKREENAEEKKLAAKKAEKKRAETEKETPGMVDGKDKVTVTAGSWDELLKKIDDVVMSDRADNILTEAEKKIGQNFDFSL